MGEAVRVLELGRGTASAWAGRQLADSGADVVKIEPPAGDPARSRGLLFEGLNLNKRGAVLDIHTPDGQSRLEALLDWADVLVCDFTGDQAQAAGLDADTLAETHPALVVLSITPFGVTGPRAHYHATELTVAHGGGWATICPATHDDPELPPLKVYGEQCALMAGVAGAMAALAAVRDVRRSGVGEFIDLSQVEYVASVLELGIPAAGYLGQVVTRYQPRSLIPWGIFPTRDGAVFLVCVEQDQWERLVTFMGNPEWAELEIFADQPGRMANQDVVHQFVGEFIAQQDTMTLFHAAQAQRIPVAPVLDYPQLAEAQHLHERGFFVDVEQADGSTLPLMAPPVLRAHGRDPITRRAPLPGEHDADLGRLKPRSHSHTGAAPALPLADVRVVDLTWAWAGPFCTMNLAHLGADVIRLESATRPDLYRRLPVYAEELEPHLDRSGMFNQWNQGKRSVAVSLGTDAGRQVVLDFVANSDVVVQNFGTGVLERLGLGYETLREVNPDIILASISGYGQRGPWCRYAGYGPVAAALSGLCAVTGYVGGGPEELGLSMPDPTAGLTAALAVVAALERRERTGEGDHLDVTLWESTAVLGIEAWLDYLATGRQPERSGNRDAHMAPHGCYRCAGTDAWVTIACRSDGQWRRLAAIVGAGAADDARFATLAGRKANEDALDALLSAWTADQDRWTVTRVLQAAGIAAFPSLTNMDIINDPHLNARGFIERLNHPEVAVRPHAGMPWRLSRRPNGVRAPAPCLGADTRTLLTEILGYSRERIDSLEASGVLA